MNITQEHGVPPTPQPLDPSSDELQALDSTYMTFSLPTIQFTDAHFDAIIEHNLSAAETKLLFFFLGNMDAKTGKIHPYSARELASELEVNVVNFYGKDGYIAKLNETGIVHIKRKWMKFSGTVKETPHKRKRRKTQQDRLGVAMLSRRALQLLFHATHKKSDIRMFLALALYTDIKTGELWKVQRTQEWAKEIQIATINVDRSVDFLINIGLVQMKRDYVVQGQNPYVALGHGYLMLDRAHAKERAKREKENRRGPDKGYREIEAGLLKYFGLNAIGWMKRFLMEARTDLLFWLDKENKEALAKIKAMA